MSPPREDKRVAANRKFVDRETPQELFAGAAFDIPPDRAKLLIFYGVGGQGKTALCRKLLRNTRSDPSYRFLRCAELDLHGRQKDDSDLLLVWIRNGFAEAGVDLPAFDLALAVTWEATRGEQPFPVLSKPWLARTTVAAKGGVEAAAKELIGDVVGEIPGVGFLLKRIGGWAIDKSKRFYLHQTRDSLRTLYRDGELKKPYELSAQLPRILAGELNHHLAKNPDVRFVLFIDEYERVFDEGGAGARWSANPFDNHIRTLIQYSNGLLAVIFSRERLPWEDDPEWRDDLKDAQHMLGGLAENDADKFLLDIPIDAVDIRRAIIDGAREEPRSDAPIYPLMLDLQVDHWQVLAANKVELTPCHFRVIAETFEGRRREIVSRVLCAYGVPLQMTIERLSVAQRFDRRAFEHVVNTFGTGLPLDSFDRIANLSFVTKGDDGFLTIHNVIAETIRRGLDPERRQTSIEALFVHYSARATVQSSREVKDTTVTALVEAVVLRRAQGIEGFVAWLGAASRPIYEAARYASAAELWREQLDFVEAELGPEHPDTATSLNNLAFLLAVQGDLAGARPLHERALAIREKALGAEHPDTVTSLNNLAGALRDQGDLEGARPLVERALAISEKALGAEHFCTVTSLNNLAELLSDQGDLAGARPAP